MTATAQKTTVADETPAAMEAGHERVTRLVREKERGVPTHPMRKWRIMNEIPLRELAARLGMSEGYLSRIERWRVKHIGPKNAKLLEGATGVPRLVFLYPEHYVPVSKDEEDNTSTTD